MQNNVNTNISWYEGYNYKKFGQKIKNFKIVCTKYMASSEAMTSSTHSFAYIHTDWSRNVSWKFAKLQNVITSLFSTDFHQVFTVLFRKIYSFFWNYVRSAPDFPFKKMSMQTLTWDVDAAAVAGNSDAYNLALATQARQQWEIQLNLPYLPKLDVYHGKNTIKLDY